MKFTTLVLVLQSQSFLPIDGVKLQEIQQAYYLSPRLLRSNFVPGMCSNNSTTIYTCFTFKDREVVVVGTRALAS